jgi:hypothetical protein
MSKRIYLFALVPVLLGFGGIASAQSQSPHSRPSRHPKGKMWIYLVGAGMLGLVAGCATTQQVQPNIMEKAQGAQNPVPQFSGFLGDYTLLQPGGQGQALYRYINPAVNWGQYNAVMIDPVTFWGGQDSSVPPKDQQFLCEYFYNKLRQRPRQELVRRGRTGTGCHAVASRDH